MAEYIEREKIRESYEKLTRSYVNGNPYIADWRFDEMIESLPASDVDPVRHGRWIPEEHEDRVSPTMTHRYRWYHCSVCGRRLIGYSNPKDAPYCHCGAKMNEEVTDNG